MIPGLNHLMIQESNLLHETRTVKRRKTDSKSNRQTRPIPMSNSPTSTEYPSEMKLIPVADCQFDPDAMRGKQGHNSKYTDLVANIAQHGVQTPIIVNALTIPGQEGKPDERVLSVIAGTQRVSACKDLGITHIMARVYTDLPKNVANRLQLSENLHRITPSTTQFRAAILQIEKDGDRPLTLDEIAATIQKPKSYVISVMSFANLVNQDWVALVDQKVISFSNLETLAKLPANQQTSFLEQAKNMSADDFGQVVRGQLAANRKAATEGKTGEAVFVPVSSLRPKAAIETEANKDGEVRNLVEGNPEIKSKADGLAGAKLALAWVLSMDQVTLDAKRAEHEKRIAEKKAAAEKRRLEREAAAATKATETGTRA
jgi:ParB/RepB/Spo0J family partition protein